VNPSFERFLRLPEVDRVDVFAAAAQRLGTLPSYVEKDFWVCLVLDALYNGLPVGHPRLLFKGGTSLSKGFGLIRRFSEDIDIVVFRHDLGFTDGRDPAGTKFNFSRKKRGQLFEELKATCSDYIVGKLAPALSAIIDGLQTKCRVMADEADVDQQTLLVEYPSVFDAEGLSYVLPRVKIESGARSALDPHAPRTIVPFVAGELAGWDLAAGSITTIEPARTYWEKLLILPGGNHPSKTPDPSFCLAEALSLKHCASGERLSSPADRSGPAESTDRLGSEYAADISMQHPL
jgi:hypothetical protein